MAAYHPTVEPFLGGYQNSVDEFIQFDDPEENQLQEMKLYGSLHLRIPHPRPPIMKEERTVAVDKFTCNHYRGDGKTRTSPNYN